MYCEPAAMMARFGEDELLRLTDNGAGILDNAALLTALSDASDEIDSYLSVRHSLPLANVPDLLKRLCADIARYRLYDERMLDEVQKRYDDSIKLLQAIARGHANLPVTLAVTKAGITLTQGRQNRVFTRDTLESF